MIVWLTRKENKNVIDKQLRDEIQRETKYFYNVLKRVVAVIKFLSERGLPFRGHNEKFGVPDNGNFMGCLELISEFDPFLKEHIQNKAKHSITYLSKTVYEEIITLMAKQVLKKITEEINNDDTKYYSLIVDSTPDVAHIDQLSIIVRYCYKGEIYERFLTLCPISSHTGVSLFNVVKDILNQNNLPIENCRGQSYDNAANMAGKYNGLQAHLKKENKFAIYTPCAAHSLNLVGVEAASVIGEVVSFFGLVQQLFVFFSSSAQKWGVLMENLKKELDYVYSPKNLGKTRWSSHYDAVRALKNGYNIILTTLKNIYSNSKEKTDNKVDAKNIYSKLITLENAILLVFWEEVLERINKVNKKLQMPGLDVSQGSHLINSLALFISEIRSNINEKLVAYETAAKKLSENVNKDYKCERKRTKRFADGETSCELLIGRDKFRIEIMNVILDKFTTELQKRGQIYEETSKKFQFLFDIGNRECENIDTESIKEITKFYDKDITDLLENESIHFKKYLEIAGLLEVHEQYLDCVRMLKIIFEKQLIDTFPNLYTILKIFSTLPIANCEAERSFSRMSYIKNKYRNTTNNERLADLCILSIENDITRSLTYDDVIEDYASKKCRKIKQ